MSNKDSLALGSDTRPPVLFRGDFYQWKKRMTQFIRKQPNTKWIQLSFAEGPHQFKHDETGELLTIDQLIGDRKDRAKGDEDAMLLMMQALPNDLYSQVDSFTCARDIMNEICKQMQGYDMSEVTRMSNALTLFEDFKQTEGELLQDTYQRYCTILNELRKNNIDKPHMELNMRFLKRLDADWSKHGTNVIANKKINKLNIHEVVEVLMLHQPEVVKIQAEKHLTTPSSDPLALIARKQSSRSSSKHKSKKVMVESESEDSESTNDSDIDDSHKELIKAHALFTKAINRSKFFKKPSNNQLRTSSSSSYKKPENRERADYPRPNQVSAETKVEERRCYNCGLMGHFAKDCRKPRKKDAEYYKHKMLLAKQEEAGVALMVEDDAWLHWTDDESEDLQANVCFMTKLVQSKELEEEADAQESSDDETQVEIPDFYKACVTKMMSDIRSLSKQVKVLTTENAFLKTNLKDKDSNSSSSTVLNEKFNLQLAEKENELCELKQFMKDLKIERTNHRMRADCLSEEVQKLKDKLEFTIKNHKPSLDCLSQDLTKVDNALTEKTKECVTLKKKVTEMQTELEDYEIKMYRTNQARVIQETSISKQTLFMNRPKNSYIVNRGLGFTNPETLQSARTKIKCLYDGDCLNYGLPMKFLYPSTEEIAEEVAKRSSKSFNPFSLIYDKINDAYKRGNPKYSHEHIQIFLEGDGSFQNNTDSISKVKPYTPTLLLEKCIESLKQELDERKLKYFGNEMQFLRIIKVLQHQISSLESKCQTKCSDSESTVECPLTSQPKTNNDSFTEKPVPKVSTKSIGINVDMPDYTESAMNRNFLNKLFDIVAVNSTFKSFKEKLLHNEKIAVSNNLCFHQNILLGCMVWSICSSKRVVKSIDPIVTIPEVRSVVSPDCVLNQQVNILEKQISTLTNELQLKKTIYYSKEKRFLKIIDQLQTDDIVLNQSSEVAMLKKQLEVNTSVHKVHSQRLFAKIIRLEKENEDFKTKINIPKVEEKVTPPESKTRFAKTSMYSKPMSPQVVTPSQIFKKGFVPIRKDLSASTSTHAQKSLVVAKILTNPKTPKREVKGKSPSIAKQNLKKSNQAKFGQKGNSSFSTKTPMNNPKHAKLELQGYSWSFSKKTEEFYRIQNSNSRDSKSKRTISPNKSNTTPQITNTNVLYSTGLKTKVKPKQVWIPKSRLVQATSRLASTHNDFKTLKTFHSVYVVKNLPCNNVVVGPTKHITHAENTISDCAKYVVNDNAKQKGPIQRWVTKYTQ